MIHFHGGPITPDTCALKAWKGRHAFISFANAGQLALASEVTQSFALDNGAFSFWTKKRVVDWNEYYRFVERWANHPRFSFAIIPDVIGGSGAYVCSMPIFSAIYRCHQLIAQTWPAILVSINHGRNQPMRRPAKRLAPLYLLSVSSQ